MNGKTYLITTKGDRAMVQAESVEDALRKYFHSLTKDTLSKLGQVVICHDESGESYPFRTIPSLVLLGLLPFPTAVETLQKVLGTSRDETIDILLATMQEDKWILKV